MAGVVAGTEALDPKGDFGGLMKPVDDWFKRHLGFDPSNIDLGGSAKAAEAPYEIRRPTPPHTPTPSVSADTSSLDAAFGKIKAIDDARPSVKVGTDTSALDDAIEKLLQIRRLMNAIDPHGVGSGLPPSLGSTMRSNLTYGGINGE